MLSLSLTLQYHRCSVMILHCYCD